jgi:DNA-binding IclR family transcriptional regulator
MEFAIANDDKQLAPIEKRSGKNHLVRTTFAILRSFTDMDDGLTSRDLARRAQIPNSSGHRIVSTLEEIGALSRGPQGRYRPGFLLASLALSVDVSHVLRRLSRDIVCDLASRLILRTQIAVLQDGIVHTIAEANAHGVFAGKDCADTCLDPFASAAGKVLLAGLSADRLERFLSANRQFALRRPEVDPKSVKHDLVIVKGQGFALDNLGNNGLQWLAVPIFDRNERVVAALSVLGTSDQIALDARGDIRAHLFVAAAAIRGRTGPPDAPND